MDKRRRVSIKLCLYVLLIVAILFIAITTTIVSYNVTVNQVNDYYDMAAKENAVNASHNIDGDFIKLLREHLESSEYQELRDKAEEDGDEELIKQYLIDNGLWDKFCEIRRYITDYINSVSSIEYLYIIAYSGVDGHQDMYILDDETVELTEMGYYEDREVEFEGFDLINMERSVLNNSETWGWLYSNYAPLYDSNGDFVAMVGCDVSLDDVIASRHRHLFLIIGYVSILTIIFILVNIFLISKLIVHPLQDIAKQVNGFHPRADMEEDDESIMSVKTVHTDEIADIAINIKNLELDVIKFIHNLEAKDEQITKLDKLSMQDSLTGVGNVHAYKLTVDRLNKAIEDSNFAILMADINNLKIINDSFGHKEGDAYISACCSMLCKMFKHSPVFRIGGDEFVVIVQHEDFDNRHKLYEALEGTYNSNFVNMSIPVNLRYSMSLGMADKQASDVTIDTVFKRADKAMYTNKNSLKEKLSHIENS